jgi:Zn-dependent protease with chaperone function
LHRVSTQFFERQETQRSQTRWLVLGFIAAFLLVTVVINLVVVVGLFGDPRVAWETAPQCFFWTSLVVIGTMLISAWHKSSQLRAGGAVVARSLGGVLVTADDGDPKRKRLSNIVEEMAIAARIRKPQVFVLPDEPGINAFAAGHSPDEAAVAVTQGALDKLDRDQLQAVVGHEFSHVLNGDMRINMRLTTWLFGLMVITDLATRIMNRRGGGKGAAQLKLVALGVFLAGSIGLLAGRLLQAAVSRRREHLADASAVQFTRNPAALQGAFIVMAATAEGSRLEHDGAVNVAHMFFAHSAASWAKKLGTSWFSTHPPLEERVRAIDSRISDVKFKLLVSDERRKIAARAAQTAGEAASAQNSPASDGASAAAPLDMLTMPVAAAAAATPARGARSGSPLSPSRGESALSSSRGESVATNPTASGKRPALALVETLPTGVRLIAGRVAPPDVLRSRLSAEQQHAIIQLVAQVEKSPLSVQATWVAGMLAAEPAKWRVQLTRLAPLLGVELMKETQAMVARVHALPPAARLPMQCDLLLLLDTLAHADRKRLRAVARAFAPTVSRGDMLRFALTRILEKRLAKPSEPPPPVPLPDRAAAVCEVYAALAQARFGAGNQGQGAYRAGLMGLMPPQKWTAFPEALLAPAQLDAALIALAQVHAAGRRSFADGMARVIAVGGLLTVPQLDLLRATCLLVDCPVPELPADLVLEEHEPVAGAQVSAR